MLAGVCQGVAAHLGWPVGLVRGGFLVLAVMEGLGLFLYGALWVLLPPAREEVAPQAPGLAAAGRSGMRKALGQAQPSDADRAHSHQADADLLPRRRGVMAARDRAALMALGLFSSGLVLLSLHFGLGPSTALLWPFGVAAAGVAMVWRQADVPSATDDGEAEQGLWARRGPMAARVTVGMGLVGVAVTMVAASRIGVGQLPLMLAMAALMVLGVGIASAPWLTRLRRNARHAHEQALLEQARADMAAHLHDSVLQTLALIQRQSDDSRAVASLARRQERELRAWLYGDEPTDASLRTALTRAAQQIEDERGVDVELVVVGDHELDSSLDALVRAAREAMLNAAKHSGADRVDVFCEVEDGVAEVFVRDRGAGFRMAEIADDRMGVRRSILERMERHGGTARIRSEPGEGTEVRLVMKI